MTTAFQLYQSLSTPRQEIRLLDIAPSTDFSSTVQCQIFTASLVEDLIPAFNALSYVWGDARVTSEIVINGISLQVTTNWYPLCDK
jgi:hypothetical protein